MVEERREEDTGASVQKIDYIYLDEDWEVTLAWEDKDELADDIDVGEVIGCKTLINGPDKFCARVVLSRDDAGDLDEQGLVWFDDLETAEAAANAHIYKK